MLICIRKTCSLIKLYANIWRLKLPILNKFIVNIYSKAKSEEIWCKNQKILEVRMWWNYIEILFGNSEIQTGKSDEIQAVRTGEIKCKYFEMQTVSYFKI